MAQAPIGLAWPLPLPGLLSLPSPVPGAATFRKQFLLISTNPEEAEAKGLSIRFWDFLFYASFGFVVTSSVAIAGVLLVFCYLIVPSVGAMLFADRVGRRLAIGWTM